MSSETIYTAQDVAVSEDLTNVHYVYVYFDPKTKVPFYVGKGKGDRAYNHITDARNSDKNSYRLNKIRKILREGAEPIIEFAATDLSEEEAFELEIQLIAEYGRHDLGEGPLTNLTNGGEGASGCVIQRDPTIYHFVHWDGREEWVTRYEMQDKHDIGRPSMCNLLCGKTTCTGGWFLDFVKDDSYIIDTNTYHFVHEDGREVDCTRQDMCKIHGVPASLIKRLIDGEIRQSMGWYRDCLKDKETKLRDATVYRFVNYDGRQIDATQSDMINLFGLDASAVCMVVSGRMNHTKGWCLNTLKDNPMLVGKKYTFVNGFTDETVIRTQRDMVSEYGLSAGEVSAVAKGKRKSTNGWFLERVPASFKMIHVTKHKFIHGETKDIRYMTGREFAELVGQSTGKATMVIRGERNHVDGWFYETIKDCKYTRDRGIRVN